MPRPYANILSNQVATDLLRVELTHTHRGRQIQNVTRSDHESKIVEDKLRRSQIKRDQVHNHKNQYVYACEKHYLIAYLKHNASSCTVVIQLEKD